MDNQLEEINQHQVEISRVATSILKDNIYPSLSATYFDIKLIIQQFGNINSIRDVDKLNNLIDKAIEDNLSKGFDAATKEMEELAIAEADYTAVFLAGIAGALSASFGMKRLKTPTDLQIKKQLRESIMSLTSGNSNQSGVWGKFITGYKDSVTRKYNSVITRAFKDYLDTGKMKTSSQIAKQILNISNKISKRDAETLVRTGVQHYISKAKQLVAMRNSDIIDREVPVVTFDSNTTAICISISAKYPNGWLLGKSPIGLPPYHFWCRTIIEYLIKGQKTLTGTKPAQGANGEIEIKASTPFGKWLRTQPKEFIYKTLGKKKGQEFLKGNLPLANLTDEYLNPLTIKELGFS